MNAGMYMFIFACLLIYLVIGWWVAYWIDYLHDYPELSMTTWPILLFVKWWIELFNFIKKEILRRK